MKYATLTGLGLLLNIWIVAANAWSSGEKTDFTLTKQQMIYQLNDQLSCIETASDHEDLSACNLPAASASLSTPPQPEPAQRNASKPQDEALIGFF